MQTINCLNVKYHGQLVGRVALNETRLTAFEYDKKWLAEGFSISPFSLPLKPGLFLPKHWEPFEGTFGIFSDSLPDGWGRLLVDRTLSANHIDPEKITILQRLAIVGQSGMGALTYGPELSLGKDNNNIFDLDILSKACWNILNMKDADNLDSLFLLGGSSGGARPKILIEIDNEKWIIKFPSTYDHADIGEEEYRYSLCASECGIEVPKTRLFPSKITSGYFGTRRFDIAADSTFRRIHMASVSALLETSHRLPNLDYVTLLKLTLALTKDYSELEKMYRLMCFNVYAHNRDDHSKNISFIYDDIGKHWKLSPAYDLTYSSSVGGEHATTVAGEGKNPTIQDILRTAKEVGLNLSKAKIIAAEIQEKTRSLLVQHK